MNNNTVHRIPYTVGLTPYALRREKGVGVIGAIFAVMLLAAVGAGLAYLSSSGQQARIQQVTGDQASYTVHAGLEFGLGQILKEHWAGDSIIRQFSGEDIYVARSGGRIEVHAAEQDASASYSITDPSPATVDCIITDISGQYWLAWSPWHLLGITLARDPACSDANVVITGASRTTWEPNLNENIYLVEIGDEFTQEFQGSVPSGGDIIFQNNYTLNNNTPRPLIIRWSYKDMRDHDFVLRFQYSYKGHTYEEVVPLSFLADNQASCFAWNTSAARLNWEATAPADWKYLGGTSVTNSCDKPLRTKSMTISWTPAAPTRNFTTFRIWNFVNSGSDIRFTGSNANGAETMLDYTLGPAAFTRAIDYFRFDGSMLAGARNYTIVWKFADETTLSVPLNLFATNENVCLTVNTANSRINPSNLKQIIGLQLQNTCAADIGITDMRLTWNSTPTGNLRQAIIIDTNGSNTYAVNSASPASIDFSTFAGGDIYLRNEDGAKDITNIQFNTLATLQAYTLDFTMADGTTKSVTFTPQAQANSLVVNTASAAIGGSGSKDLIGITLRNSGTNPITWDKAVVSWTPTTGGRTLTGMYVNGVSVWPGGTKNNGDTTDITNVAIGAAQTVPINYFRFSSSMNGRTFTIQFIMQDGSTYTTPPFTTP